MLVCYLTTTLYECGCIMDISTVLNVKNIKLNMTARTKEEVIEELTDLLIEDGAVTNKEDFIRDVWLREELGSTGFENHIAIPHGKSSGVSRTALAIGRTQHAIPLETMDGSDVRCVILFAVCPVDQKCHPYSPVGTSVWVTGG